MTDELYDTDLCAFTAAYIQHYTHTHTHTHTSASDSVGFLRHCTLYIFTYLLT